MAGPTSSSPLLFADWLTANPGVQADYLAAKRAAEAQAHPDTGSYAEAKEPWFLDAYRRAWEWAYATGWAPRRRFKSRPADRERPGRQPAPPDWC